MLEYRRLLNASVVVAAVVGIGAHLLQYFLSRSFSVMLFLVAVALAVSILLGRLGTPGAAFAYPGRLALQIYLAHVVFTAGTRVALVPITIADPVIDLFLGTAVGIAGPPVLEHETRGQPSVSSLRRGLLVERNTQLRAAARLAPTRFSGHARVVQMDPLLHLALPSCGWGEEMHCDRP